LVRFTVEQAAESKTAFVKEILGGVASARHRKMELDGRQPDAPPSANCGVRLESKQSYFQ
jgi:hypothetical protein